ncbi:MAG: M1 family metallopeptidase [Schleiferiaceae bacterium]|nr:M1 family metallopeptidase [Schleiferiaceae bacterium]MDO7583187.1 M1 family metallopeptidase [Schleiferiaceae bacterium]MDO7593100.1 M1 family metallopeptidase [Schleiferiaceae bacterium]
MKHFIQLFALLFTLSAAAQSSSFDRVNTSKFKQLGTELPTANSYRTASGAPGHAYYQQQADYVIQVTLDEEKHHIDGHEVITYHNNSPDVLTYLWVQLDQNVRSPNSMTQAIKQGGIPENISPTQVESQYGEAFPGGFNIHKVSLNGQDLKHTIINTMMRLDLPKPLQPGKSISFSIDWDYNINDRMSIGGRSGYEHFSDENNTLYTIAQFYPRMAVYSDYQGWQHKQFLGQGEFTLPFGDFTVSITVPSDHIVASTGSLQNPSSVLSSSQRKRYAEARRSFDQPVIVASQEEAESREQGRSTSTATWTFKAENVRDFAFASSRKFIWDAQAVNIGGKVVMAESFYPKEGNPLWEQYSTRIVAHSLKVYSKYTTNYTYPRAISVHAKSIGMEYPMICFNGGRPDADGTYSEATKHGMLSVIIHEVGHNFFPMIINSDERQWTWMDEGLNSFVQYLAEMEWDVDYPSRRGPAYKIARYMQSPALSMVPIMTNSESIKQFGDNAYGKPATGLNILRETVLGRELFDFAFKTYCERWAFKHPEPADLFRSMEDASGVDLDWFWRGWFYTTDYTDQALTQVRIAALPTTDPQELESQRRAEREKPYARIGRQLDVIALAPTVVDSRPETRDFYNNSYNRDAPNEKEIEHLASLASKGGYPKGYLHEVTVENRGGLLMPVIVSYEFEDGSEHVERWPVEIWIKDEKQVTKTILLPHRAISVSLDPFLETADTDTYNNDWPAKTGIHLEGVPRQRGYEIYRYNPMREAQQLPQ